MDETLLAIGEIVERRRFAYAVTPNVDHTVKLRKSALFRELYSKASLVVADGVPLLWAARLLGTPLKERINGTDLFERTCEFAAQRGYSVFLLGGSPGAADSACAELVRRHPALKIAGCVCPPFGFYKHEAQNKAIQQTIQESGADILFVGLGAPQQEQWMCDFAARLRRILRHRSRRILQLRRWLDSARSPMDAAQRPGMVVALGKRTSPPVETIPARGFAILRNAAPGHAEENPGATVSSPIEDCFVEVVDPRNRLARTLPRNGPRT